MKMPEFAVYESEVFSNISESGIEGRFYTRCPVTKQKDYLWLKVSLVPNNLGQFIEYVSFSQWLVTLGAEELGLEGSCNVIFEAIERLVQPNLLTVEVKTGYKYMNQKAIRTNKFLYGDKI
jgi:NADPH-dependent 7-cyano-7-deazaguanine reductase QueF